LLDIFCGKLGLHLILGLEPIMKIALLSYEYPFETGFGGIGTYTWYQARALSRLGHEVHVLAGATSPTRMRGDDHDGVSVHRFRSTPQWLRFLALDRQKLCWTKNRIENGFSMYEGLRQLLNQHQYDILEMPECGAEGLLINYFIRVPSIVKFHSPAKLIMPCYEVRKADQLLCSIVEHMGIRGASSYTSCSRFLAEEVRRQMGISREIRIIPNGIDLGLFDASEQIDARKQYDLPKDKPMIFFAGRMERRKGIHLCKEIVAGILKKHDVAFVFAGDDLFQFMAKDILPSLREMNLRGTVRYLGRLDLQGVRSCLRQADIFLIPSLWENCPYSCLEAMAAGRAIVSSNAGGLPELIQHGENGLLAQSGDPNEFVSCLEQLIASRDMRARLGNAARRTIESTYTDIQMARLSVEFYGQLSRIR
jgi:glycosyltransferase involved in cell wall biosynthesis